MLLLYFVDSDIINNYLITQWGATRRKMITFKRSILLMNDNQRHKVDHNLYMGVMHHAHRYTISCM